LILRELLIWKRLTSWLKTRQQITKTLVIISTDMLFLVVAVLLSYALRLSAVEIPAFDKLPLYILAPCLSVLSAIYFGLYKTVSRNYSGHIEKRILLSQLAVPLVWSLIVLGVGVNGFARSVILIYFLLSIFTMVAIRRVAAWSFGDTANLGLVPHAERIKIIIYGAGREGILLIESLNRQGRYLPVAFVDTDYTLVGRTVAGLKVYSTEDLSEVIHRFNPREVMIAKPRQNRANRRILVETFMAQGMLVKTVPGIDEIVDGNIDVNAMRPIKLEDLLGRDPVPPDKGLMERAVYNQVVMVSGAGGSIGSELVRQVSVYAPRKIILVDNNEYSLFEIHREIEAQILNGTHQFELIALLTDIQDKSRVEQLVEEHGVTVILHAAAYKHVRMVQENAAAGIRNNIWGTMYLAQAASKHKVKLFILVSTDKAVRPTSIMGATKRVAEMVVQAIAKRKDNDTVFAIVRFGNVLGSTGSVIPLFQEQIERGGPVIVTHPDVTRFFMLIPEAAQLVIQAGAMAEKGEVFVLDMGESVKIHDLAETMIELAGLSVKTPKRPDGDIEIKIAGLRDGEKLYEELHIGRDVSVTSHQRIMRSNEFFLPWEKLEAVLAKIGSPKAIDKSRIKELFSLALMDS
jgi:FlaA1/EpsC-like NDP-sugar epimerase